VFGNCQLLNERRERRREVCQLTGQSIEQEFANEQSV